MTRKHRIQVGERVRTVRDPRFPSAPERRGVILRWWDPYDQARVQWDDGRKTNIWSDAIEPEGAKD